MTVHVHFFGCSYTAGDELADEEFFPWKFTEPHTPDSYTAKKREFFKNNPLLTREYRRKNASMAYPALINSPNILTTNHAQNGQSVRTNVFKVLELTSTRSDVDMIYFQISPSGREMYIDSNNNVTSIQLQLALKLAEEAKLQHEYAYTKLKTHSIVQYSIEDLMDMYILTGFLKSKGIPFKFLVFGSELDIRSADILELKKFNFLTNNLSDLPIINVPKDLLGKRLLHLHISHQGHQNLAEFITTDICQTLNISK